MTNKEIAKEFSELADLMELHDQNEFKVRTYRNAYMSIRRFPEPIEELEPEAIMGQRGIGKSVALKIEELLDYGRMEALEELRDQTPQGIRDMLNVKGLGPKKIKTIWRDMGIENVTDLMYACNENRLIEAHGFGAKTQADVLSKLQFYLASRDKMLYATAEALADRLRQALSKVGVISNYGGELLRRNNIIDDLVLHCKGDPELLTTISDIKVSVGRGNELEVIFEEEIEATLKFWEGELDEVIRSEEAPERLRSDIVIKNSEWGEWPVTEPPPELWDNTDIDLQKLEVSELVGPEDIKGVIHSHSIYSDGSHTVEQMALASRARGYQYLVMSDHSRSAFYANGLDEDRVLKQWEEIDKLNEKIKDFRIFKSIESDILFDGQLDYRDEFLEGFDLVIASVHSQLKMDEEKATQRLISAIEHPATRILGHMTGRLILGRAGYPVDHDRIIDACAANDVVIELNANPYRLDIDWRYIQKAQEKDVMISINPDAHSTDGIDDIRYGVLSARKGGLLKGNCLSCKTLSEFEAWIEN